MHMQFPSYITAMPGAILVSFKVLDCVIYKKAIGCLK